MAKINPVKVKQDADKLEKGGKLDQAIALHRQIVEDNPRDWNTINKIGDLYAKLNKNREASEEYAKVADFYAKDGFLLKAIAIWKKINKLDASALDPYLNLAELYAKQGLMMEAKSQYQIVVEEYIKRGRMREAGDVLKKMADIDPADLKVRSKLADLYTRDGNAAKAVEEHIAIADELTKKGHLAEALQVLEKGLKIDPKGTKLRGELARIHFVQKNYERAAHFLEEAVQHAPSDTQLLAKLGEAYIGGKRIEEAEAIFKRLLELDPNDQESRIQIARVYLLQGQFDQAFEQFVPVADRLLDRREGEKAAALLQQIVQANPSHVKSLVKLVEIYRVLQKESAVAATYSQLTEAYTNEGQWEQAASVLEILVSMEPQNQQHRNKLQFVRSKLGPVAPVLAPAPVVEEEEFDLSSAAPETPAFPLGEPPAPPPTAAPAPVGGVGLRPPIEMTGPLSDEDQEFVEEHLAEGKVFRKYGLVDKAADQFESVIARFPDNVDARQELREVYKEKGLNAKAAEQCLTLAEIFRLKGDVAEAEAQDAEAARLAPGAAPAPAKPAAPLRPAPPPTAPIEAAEEEIAVPEAEEEIPLDVEEEAPAEEAAAEEPAVQASQEEAFDLDTEPQAELETLDLGGEITGEDLAPQFVEEEPPVPETPLGGIEIGMVPEEEFPLEEPAPPPPPPTPPPAPAPLRAAPAKPVVAKPAVPPPLLRPPVLKAPPPPPILKAPPPPPSPSGLPADLQKVLDEVDSYVSLGFVDDAKDALREVASKHPGHPAILDKISELGLDQELVQEAAPEAVAELPEAVEEEAGPLDELQLEEPVAPSAAEEPSPLEEALGELGELSLPEPTLEAPEPGFPEPSFPEPALGETGLPDVGLPEAELPEVGPPDVGLPEAELPEAELPEVGLPELPEVGPPEVEMPEVGLPEAGPPEAGLDEGGLSDLGLQEPEPVAAAQEGGMDLSAELGELFGAQSVEEPQVDETSAELGDAGLAEIFKEFKKGVDKQLGKEDYDTRYNLGIAYKEMGLIDEAIAEFQLAAKDGGRLLECSSMLGICFMEKGMPKLAVKWFEKGLKAQGRSEEEYQGLRYDLALAYEAAGEIDKAYAIYTELYGQDANFRDVANKVRELKAALG